MLSSIRGGPTRSLTPVDTTSSATEDEDWDKEIGIEEDRTILKVVKKKEKTKSGINFFNFSLCFKPGSGQSIYQPPVAKHIPNRYKVLDNVRRDVEILKYILQ